MVNDYTHKIVIKEDGTQSLIIVPAMPQDSGEWTVVAQNRAGRTSVSVTLNVDGKTKFKGLLTSIVSLTFNAVLCDNIPKKYNRFSGLWSFFPKVIPDVFFELLFYLFQNITKQWKDEDDLKKSWNWNEK